MCVCERGKLKSIYIYTYIYTNCPICLDMSVMGHVIIANLFNQVKAFYLLLVGVVEGSLQKFGNMNYLS